MLRVGSAVVLSLCLGAAASAEEAAAPSPPPPVTMAPIPDTPKRPARGAEAEAPRPSAGGIVYRFGYHDSYNRFVLEWPQAVHAQVSAAGGTATVVFDRPAHLDVPRLDAILPESMRPAALSADGMTLTFKVPADRALQDHSYENFVVMDLVTQGGKPPAETAAAPPPAAPPPSPARPAKGTAATRPVIEVGAPAVPAPPPPQKPAPAAASPPPAKPAPAAKPPAATPAAPPAADAASARPQEAALPPKMAPAADAGLMAESSDHQLRITRTALEDGSSLRFEWHAPTAAAVFELGTAVWVVFDRHQILDIKKDVGADGHPSPAIVQLDNRTATVLWIPMPADTKVSVGRTGDAWIVDLHAKAMPDVRQHIKVVNRGNLYPVDSPGSPVTFVDPESNELLMAVPLPKPGEALETSVDHGTYLALGTLQGLLFRPRDDSVGISVAPDGVRVGPLVPASDVESRKPQ